MNEVIVPLNGSVMERSAGLHEPIDLDLLI